MRREALYEVALFALAALSFLAAAALRPEASAGMEPGPPPRGALRVATWNVGGAGRRMGHPLEEEHLPHVARVLREIEPDLAFLQEVRDGEQLVRLLHHLGREWTGAIAGGTGRQVAALARHGSLERIERPDLAPEAIAVRWRSRRRELVALGLHASAFSSSRRNLQIGRATDALLEIAGDLPRLLAGDLNLDLDPDKRQDLFTDDEHRDVESYNYLARTLVDAARGSGPTAEPDRRLDYLFVDPRAFRVLAAGPWPDRRAGDMDHHPLVADLAW